MYCTILQIGFHSDLFLIYINLLAKSTVSLSLWLLVCITEHLLAEFRFQLVYVFFNSSLVQKKIPMV